ncbi:PorH family porin [uncultured Corynebacterium sp.]|uniref:PorH family porin n=1 Tax=uncultured Corynebacterium sp. TaxID=159447 RepID=UPI0025CD19E8|nr:PorH family porin [uncultured Corynebacterium sp.]
MDLNFIGEQLGNFGTFTDGLEKLFKGFARAFDGVAGAVKQGDDFEAAPDTSAFTWMSSK